MLVEKYSRLLLRLLEAFSVPREVQLRRSSFSTAQGYRPGHPCSTCPLCSDTLILPLVSTSVLSFLAFFAFFYCHGL